MKHNMKSFSVINIHVLIATFILTMTLGAEAQITTQWKGGTPGKKNEWSCANNWSTQSVPDEFSDVIIPDMSTSSLSLPVISMGIVEVNSLSIESNSSLTIEKPASLAVLDHIEGVSKRTISGTGKLIIQDEIQTRSIARTD